MSGQIEWPANENPWDLAIERGLCHMKDWLTERHARVVV